MKISIVVMAHPDRETEANKLFKKLSSMPFAHTWLAFDMNNDEWRNGKRCLQWGTTAESDTEWHVIVQDDAIIGDSFYENVVAALEGVPKNSLVSFYTGTVRPEQERVLPALKKADSIGASWLSSNSLYWGVGIAIPTADIESLIDAVDDSILPYDRRIGSYFAMKRRPVYYTVPSIVDHDDTLPSLIGNDRPGEIRRAHNYFDGTTDFNDVVVRIV